MISSKFDIHESLVKLYLRLNGYFTSGFIVHSALEDQVLTELDILAVRFPHSIDADREAGFAPELEVSADRIDFLICEVKSGCRKSPQFNKPLWNDPYSLPSVFRRLGCISADDVPKLADTFRKQLTPTALAGADFPTVNYGSTIQIRGILFATGKVSHRPGQAPFIYGTQIINYVHACLCPNKKQDKCSTRYSYEMWREPDLIELVRYFKGRKLGSGPGSIEDLEQTLNG